MDTAYLRNLLNPLRRRTVVFCNPTDHPLVEMALRELRKEGYEVAAKPARHIPEGTAYGVDADLLNAVASGQPIDLTPRRIAGGATDG